MTELSHLARPLNNPNNPRLLLHNKMGELAHPFSWRLTFEPTFAMQPTNAENLLAINDRELAEQY
jgi:hypothetical protein